MVTMNYVIRPFERRINTGYPMGIKLYLQTAKKIDRETENLDI